MTSAPSLEPAIAGVKVMLIVHSAPGGRVAPQLCVSPKSMPEGMMSVIVTGVAPALVSVTVRGELQRCDFNGGSIVGGPVDLLGTGTEGEQNTDRICEPQLHDTLRAKRLF